MFTVFFLITDESSSENTLGNFHSLQLAIFHLLSGAQKFIDVNVPFCFSSERFRPVISMHCVCERNCEQLIKIKVHAEIAKCNR